jgi:hypothetical protein
MPAACHVPHAQHLHTCTRRQTHAPPDRGRNSERQCGIEGDAPVVLTPTVVLELLQQPVRQLAAGKNNSAAVLAGPAGQQEVYVWGDGSSGKLGLGSGRNCGSPSRVEAFVGRAAVQAVALGAQHSLFLDAQGQVFACGEGKEGQLGLGTSLAVIAAQHRLAYHAATRPALRLSGHHSSQPERLMQHLHAMAAAAGGDAAPAMQHTAHGWGSLGSSWGRGSDTSSEWGSFAAAAAAGGRRAAHSPAALAAAAAAPGALSWSCSPTCRRCRCSRGRRTRPCAWAAAMRQR